MTNVATQQDTVPVRGAGKKSTYAKNQLYSKPLPVGTASQGRSPYAKSQTWCDRFNEWTSWLYEKSTIDTPLYRGWYDSETCSVWMHDKGESYKLWTQGFFGKGNLSRSEPTWAVRRHAELDAKQRGQLTAEQMTQKRREERKMLKIERARAAVRAGIQLPDGIKALGGELSDSDSPDHVQWRGDEKAPEVKAGEARVKGLKHFSEELKLRSYSIPTDSDDVLDLTEFDNIEHFQLTMVEAFFLAGMLGCLEVYDTNGKLSIDALYHLCLQSQLPPLVTHRPRSSLYLRPDNPFLLSYVVYHHFRSLGWVVKSGTKFCVDYLLYKRGPVFSHAEYVKWV